MLWEPLEEHKIRISRTHGNYVFPANFMLVAALNPCPCGCYPDMERCTCTSGQIQNYLGKISQAFLDRLEICVEAPKVTYESLSREKKGENSSQIRERVCRARDIQNDRYKGTKIATNAMLQVKELDKYCRLGKEESRLIEQAFTALGLTARTYHKILKVSRTIADLDQAESICVKHIKEAIGYRTIDKKYWGR